MRKCDRAGIVHRRQQQEQRLRIEAEIFQQMSQPIDVDSDDDVQEVIASNKGSRGSGNAVGSNASGSACSTGRIQHLLRNARVSSQGFDRDIARGRAPVQPRVDVAFNVKSKDQIGQAWAKWFHANDIPGVKANCPYFIGAMKLTQQLGKGVPIPKGQDIDGPYLEKNFEEMQDQVEKFKEDWHTYGVTVMCDSWTGPTQMSIVNFMVYCNERMFFHKSVNATGEIQNADVLYSWINEVVDKEIGSELVVQLVTDNGSNFKKACARIAVDHPHIIWQPCAAHTINLMLKDLGNEPRIDLVVQSAKRISRFFYNHGRLHAEMKKKIGGEIIRPSVTRFGTMYIFLKSLWDKKDKCRLWMVSEDWKNSEWSNEADYSYTDACLSSNNWWADLKWVLDTLEPLYEVLRYADTQKVATMSGFMANMKNAMHAMEAHLENKPSVQKRYMQLVKSRVSYLYNNTLMIAAAVLDPRAHYTYGFGKEATYAKHLRQALKRIAETPEIEAKAIAQFESFCHCRGQFDDRGARIAAKQMAPAAWWHMFGGHVKVLQRLAMRIVSQCVPSSGCERNWSTFALVHTKVRNKLGYDKIHKLVYVHYNLKLRRQQQEPNYEVNLDPWSLLMDAALHDQDNPMEDWLSTSKTTTQLPNEDIMASDAVLEEPLNTWTSKRKIPTFRTDKAKKGKKIMKEEEDVHTSEEDTSSPSTNATYADTSDEDEEPFAGVSLASPERYKEELIKEKEKEKEIDAAGSKRGKTPLKEKDISTLYNKKMNMACSCFSICSLDLVLIL